MTIIAFISQKGGVGKSTLSQALVTEAQKQKISVLLADCDPQQASSHQWSKIKGKINCQVFSSVKDIWPLTKQHNLIVIDGPARTSQATKEIAQYANLIVQPTGASRLDLLPALKEFNALKQIGIPTKKLLFVLTRLSSKAEAKAIRKYLDKSDYKYSSCCLYEKASYKQVQNEGKAISEVSYKTLQNQVKKLVESILDYL